MLKTLHPPGAGACAPKESDPALSVATIYQDPLTRHWAAELWDRVGQLIGGGSIRHQSWKISELTDPRVFLDAVEVAAKADVLVVSVRDAGELPMGLYVWVDSWLPSRAGRAGALVALIGVPSQPDAQAGRAYQYLDSVACRAGLDFLPRERKLPQAPCANPGLSAIGRAADSIIPLFEENARPGPSLRLSRRLTE